MADTSNRHYPLPVPEDNLSDDVTVLIAAFTAIDADVAALLVSLAGKASLVHTHAISDILGLQSALDGKMAADATFAFEDLSDVNVADAATGYLPVKQADGTWGPMSPSAAFGAVTISMSAVTGLTAALASLAQQSDLNALATTVAGKVATADEATAAQINSNTAGKWLSTDQAWAAAAHHDQTASGSVTLDLASGSNFRVTANGNVTLANPTNAKVGQSGFIMLSEDGTGGRTFAFGASWKFVNGNVPSLLTTAGANNVLFYSVFDANFILAVVPGYF